MKALQWFFNNGSLLSDLPSFYVTIVFVMH